MKTIWIFSAVTLLTAYHAWGKQNVEIYTPYTFSTCATTLPFLIQPEGDYPTGGNMAVDAFGNVYLSDTVSNTIEMISPDGQNSTIAGGWGPSSGFILFPKGLALDQAGNLYVADAGADMILMISPEGTNWVVTALAGLGVSGSSDGTNQAARFFNPQGIAVDNSGKIFVADTGNFTIRMIAPQGADWVTTTIAGLSGKSGYVDGTNAVARFEYPSALAVDSAGNVYVADGDLVRKITHVGTNWVVSTPFGQPTFSEYGPWYVDGTNGAVHFSTITGIAMDSDDNIYVTDQVSVVRRATPIGTNWVVTTLGGGAAMGFSDGAGRAARFDYPVGITVDSLGTVYVADTGNHALRVGRPTLQMITTGSQIVLAWPTSPLGGYSLQTTTNLGAGGTWTGRSNGVTTSGVNFVSANTVDPNVGAMFFRIVPPQ